MDGAVTTRRDREDLLAGQVARLFFGEQINKSEIAKQLGMSRFRVARLIEEALARGLVRIEFEDPAEIDVERGRAIAKRFDLALCLVARTQPGEEIQRVAGIAADLLHELIQPTEVLGVAWGSTVAATVDRLRSRRMPDARVVQMAGGTRRLDAQNAPSRIAQRAAERLGAALHPLYAPAIVETTELRNALVREPDVRETIALFEHISTALVGIGSWESDARSAVIASGVLSDQEIHSAVESGAAADLVLHAIGSRGELIATPLEERSIAISYAQLQRVPRVVAVAAGAEKAPAIGAVLRTGAVHTLVIDQSAAEQLIS